MGFFNNIFKRKRGGTFFGNLLRGAASKATGGVLGSGAGLARWEAKQDEQQYNAQVIANKNAALQNNQAFASGQALGGAISGQVPKDPVAEGYVKNKLIVDWLKKHWLKVAAPVVGVVLIVVYMFKRPRRPRR